MYYKIKNSEMQNRDLFGSACEDRCLKYRKQVVIKRVGQVVI